MAPDLRDQMLAKAREAAERDGLRALQRQASALQSGAVNAAVWLAIDQIAIDQRIQVRVAGLDEDKVEQYAVILAEQGEMPPIIVFREPGTDVLYLADGFHRVEAARRAGLTEIQAEVRPGGFDGAYEYAEEANLEHGLALSIQDKRAIFERRLARGHEWANLSDRAIAKVLGVDQKTIGNWRKSSLTEEISSVSGNEGKKRAVVTADGRVMKTSKIQRANKKRAAKPQPAESEPVATFEDKGGETVVDRIMAALHEHGTLGPAHLRAVSGMSPEAFNLLIDDLMGDGWIERYQDVNTGRVYFRALVEVEQNPNAVGILGQEQSPVNAGQLRQIVLHSLARAADALEQLGETSDAQETRRYADSLKADWRLNG